MENIKEVLSVVLILSIIVLLMVSANISSGKTTKYIPHCEDSIVKIYKDYNDGKIDILARDAIILETVKYLDPLNKVE